MRERVLLAAVDAEGDDRAAAEHLAGGELVLGMGVQPRVQHARHPRVRGEVCRGAQRVLVLALTRMDSVSRPLSMTHALNGDIDGPVCRMRFLTGPAM